MDIREIAKKIIDETRIEDVISYYLPLIKKGKDYRAVCPFHDDTNPSLSISVEKKIFKCFVCGTGGNAISFVQKYENLSFTQAIKKVAQISHIDLPELEQFSSSNKEDVFAKEKSALTFLTKFYQVALNSVEGQSVTEYLKKRGLDDQQIDKFKIGFSPFQGEDTISFLKQNGYSIKNLEDIGVLITSKDRNYDRFSGRLIFPIEDENGEVVGFSGRALKKEKDIAKYMNSPESPLFQKNAILYNYHHVKRDALLKKDIYLCEGFMDVIALDRLSIPAIATMGTSLTNKHLHLLRALKTNIKVLMDGDYAGRLASLKIARTLFLGKVPFKVIHQDNEIRDPDEIIKSEGQEGLTKFLQNELSYLDYLNNFYKDDLQDRAKRDEYIKAAFEILDTYFDNDSVSFELASKSIAKTLKVSPTSLIQNYQRNSNKTIIPDASQVSSYPRNTIHHVKTSLARSEGHLLSLMLQNNNAVEYYVKNLNNLTDELYNEIASYIIKLTSENDNINFASILAIIDADEELLNQEKFRNAVLELEEETTNPDAQYSQSTLESLVARIKQEQIDYGFQKQLEAIEQADNLSPDDKTKMIAQIAKLRREAKKKKK